MLAAAGWIGFTFFRRKVHSHIRINSHPKQDALLPSRANFCHSHPHLVNAPRPAALCILLLTIPFPSSAPWQSYYDLGGRRRRGGDEPDGIEVP